MFDKNRFSHFSLKKFLSMIFDQLEFILYRLVNEKNSDRLSLSQGSTSRNRKVGENSESNHKECENDEEKTIEYDSNKFPVFGIFFVLRIFS